MTIQRLPLDITLRQVRSTSTAVGVACGEIDNEREFYSDIDLLDFIVATIQTWVRAGFAVEAWSDGA